MTDSEKLRRFGLDKIALFLLLLAGLFFAELIVSSRANIKLSRPVVLPGCGLAVSVPAGGLSDGFEYNDNEFRLSCIMQISSSAAVMVHWRYFIVPFKRTIDERFRAQASDIGGTIEETGSEQFGQLVFDYAGIVSGLSDKSGKTTILLLSGTTQLPDSRTLTLEVVQKGRNVDLAEKIFRSLAASVNFTPDNPLADGRKLLDNFRQKALVDIVQKKGRQNYYYIKNYTNQTLGFITDAISLKADRRDANPPKGEVSPKASQPSADSLTAASLYFLHSGITSLAEQSLLRCDPNLQNFKWISRQSNLLINRDLITSIELDREGTVTVKQENTVQKFTFTSTMLPEMLFDTFIESFLQSSFDSVMVDTILSDGRIAPALITRTELQKPAEPNVASAVKIAFSGTDASQQTIYFDSNGEILLSEVRGKISYKLERTEKDRLAADFPGWLEKIRQIEQYILEKSRD